MSSDKWIVPFYGGLFMCCQGCGAACGDKHKDNCPFMVNVPKPNTFAKLVDTTIYVDKSLPESAVQIGDTRFTIGE